ncbi:MAG: hypothetical protein JEY91_11940 [Spirochaetaceae bacterium]|nr:hypothetical protein [Spirochaetaceae bacterium]
MIYEKITVNLLNSDNDFNKLKLHLNRVYDEGYLSKEKWINYTVFNYIREAEKLAATSGWLEAYEFVKMAPADIKNQRKYIQLLDSCRGNYIVTIHNRFADLFNSGQYQEAEQILAEGLNVIPGDRTLNSDLQMIRNKK